MSIPQLSHCEHSDTGWCLDCVAKLRGEVALLYKLLENDKRSPRELLRIPRDRRSEILARSVDIAYELQELRGEPGIYAM